MPETASPIARGRSETSRLISRAGTWPSIANPAISAVWQEPSFSGTLSRLRASVLPVSLTLTVNPLACKCCTHPEQQSQVGDFQTSMLVRDANDRVAPSSVTASPVIKVVRFFEFIATPRVKLRGFDGPRLSGFK